MVNLLSNIQGFPIWVFITETEEGFSHIEFRSNGPAVQPIATSLGGGGHKNAAGLTIPEFNTEATNKIIAMCDEVAKRYKETGEE